MEQSQADSCEREKMFVRSYYDDLHQGMRYVHADSEILARDRLWSRADVKAQTQTIQLYSDPVTLSLESHFTDTEMYPSPSPDEQWMEGQHPWDNVGKIARSHRTLEYFRHHPINWMESWDHSALEAFDILEQLVRRDENRQSLTCEDGPCEGVVYHVEGGARRVDTGSHIYERTLNNYLRYVRETKCIQ